MPTRFILFAAIAALYVLHQDVWFWRAATPLVFGFLPIGLAYHAFYCVAAALMMWGLTKALWPSHLESPDRISMARSGAGQGAPASDELGGVQGTPPFKQ